MQNDTEKIIRERLNEEENKRFEFQMKTFEEIKELPKCDLVVSNFSLPFCKYEYFDKFWKVISNSIKKDGYFLGNFFGTNDEWNDSKKQIFFLRIDEVKELFKDFEIQLINEKEYGGKTGMGKQKHWDIIDVFAKKS